LTTSWQRFTYTGAVPSNSTQLGIDIRYTPVGTAGADDSFLITGIQVEIGSVATNFTAAGGTIQGELAACQRYYFETDKRSFSPFGSGFAYSTTNALIFIKHPMTMRTQPTYTYGTAADFDLWNSTATRLAVTAITSSSINTDGSFLQATVASGLVAGNGTGLTDDGGGAAVIKVSAEL